jgi:uncharacterized protein
MKAQIPVDRGRIADFCRRNRIRKLALFGSVLRDDFKPDSDVDVLVEFEPGARSALIRMAEMEADLRTPAELSQHFRDQVVRGAEVQYAQG